MKPSELKERTKQFAVAILRLVRQLPKDREGEAIADPLVRCGTAVGASYRSACRSRNAYDFASRIAGVEEATDESIYWLEMILEAEVVAPAKVQSTVDEARALRKIFTKSRKAATRRMRDKSINRDLDEDIPF
jgi:four helix bundle protein